VANNFNGFCDKQLVKVRRSEKKSGTKIMRSCAEKTSEIISARAEMRELTENAWVSREMRDTWHV